ncbi:hypothetical protein MMC17_001670 [Xylographa soralifera]|nr:hypothetical protein [Xylographa soralifera]
MSAEIREILETEEERHMQRAIEASLHSSASSQLSQGNSTTRRKKWEALRTSYTRSDAKHEHSPYSYTEAEHSGHRENITTGSELKDVEETAKHLNGFGGPKLPSYEEMFEARMRAIAEDSSSHEMIADAKVVPARPNIDDYIAEMQQTRAVDLKRLNMPDGDTLAFIDAPAQQPDQDDFTYKQIQARYLNPFRIRSSTLKSLCSPFFDFLLSPTAQFRVLRRRKLVNSLPYGIKFVLDLTPPNEGDDAVRLTENLSCKTGVRYWGLSCERWMVSEGLVGGKDELSRLKVQSNQTKPTTKIQWIQGKGTVTETVVVNDTANVPGGSPKTPVQKSNESTIGSSPAKESTSGFVLQDQRIGNVRNDCNFQLPADYTPIRHRFAIERVLNGVEGRDPKIDSAVKLWTTFAVARHFGIRESLLTDYIVRWLRAPPNTYFMEVQPEIALKIAEGLHCQAVGRDVFAILVGEAALAVVCEGRGTDLHYSVHGRQKEFVNELHFEPWLTRIQYARDVLVERVKAQFEDLTSIRSTWVEELPECQRLLAPTHSSMRHRPLYAELMKALKTYVRGAIYYLLCSNYSTMPGPVEDSGKGAELFPQTQFCSTWNLLTYHERVFTRAFWDNLRGCDLVMSNANYGIRPAYKYDLSTRTSHVFKDLVNAGVFKNIYPSDLRGKVDAYCLLNKYGMENTTTDATHSPAHNNAHFDQGGAWVKEGASVENRARNLPPPPAFNVAYRPKIDETGSSFGFSAADDDWRHDHTGFLKRSSHQSLYNPPTSDLLVDKTPPSGGTSDAQSIYYSQMFPMLSQHEDPFALPTHDEVFYDNAYESPSKRRCSEVSEESFSRLLAQQKRRAEENKRELEELHRRNRSSFGERQQHSETLCKGRTSSSPYRNFDPFAEDTVPAVRGSPEKNLLSARRSPGQPSFAKSAPVSKTAGPKISGRLRVYNGETTTFENKFVSPLTQAQKTPKTSPPVNDSGSFGYETDTLDSTTFAQDEDCFDLNQFFNEVEKHLHLVANEMLAAPDAGQGDPLELALTNTLVCLKESEMKFLPLWAGGNDDGSSGVFNDNVPLAESGFSTAGPKVHTGAASSTASSEFDMIRGDSTVHTSTVVNDGYSDTLERRRVYDDDSEWGAVMANKKLDFSVQTINGYESVADSESTWNNIITPAGTDDMFMGDAEEGSGARLDKGKGKMVDLTTLMSNDSISVAGLIKENKKLILEKEEEEDYSNIFMEDDEDEDQDDDENEDKDKDEDDNDFVGASSDLEDMDDDLELWNDDDFNDEIDDTDLDLATTDAIDPAPDQDSTATVLYRETADEQHAREDALRP